MNPNETRTLWISIGAALFAIFLLYSWSQEQKQQMAQKFGATKRVVIAKENIVEMATIDESKLDYVDQPVDFIQPGAISDPDEAIGQVAGAPIMKGEQIVKTKLLSPGPYTGLAMEVSPGKRAIPIPVDDVRGIAHLVRPGDRVDIVAALDTGKGNDTKREVRTILQDVVVLATGVKIANQLPVRIEPDENGKTAQRINLSGSITFTTVTVEVKPEEAQELVYILATSPGSIFLTLRHPNDRQQAPLRTTAVDDILGRPVVMKAPIPPPVFRPPPARRPAKVRKDGFESL